MKKYNNSKSIYSFSVWRLLAKIYYRFKAMAFAKHLLLLYLIITMVGAALLFSPITHARGGAHVGFVDALFTSASAFSDTGLSTMTTATTFNYFGQAVIAILIFLGGIGWFALKVYIFNILFGRQINYKTRESLAAERGSIKVGVTRELIKVAVTVLLITTLIAAVVLTIYFYYSPPTHLDSGNIIDNPYHNPYTSLRFGLFHSISALNNAGFDIIGNNSLAGYYSNYGLQIIFMFLFILGGMGYPVIYDLYLFFKTRFTGEKFQFSLFTKLSVVTYVLVSLVGLAVTFTIETTANDSFWTKDGYGSKGDKTMALVFNTMSTRNAGFSTISMYDLSRATLIQYAIMMFIGSAPSSTAGGIRTTTMAIVVLGVWSRLRGRQNVYAFKSKINKDTVNRSYVVFTLSIILVFIATLISITSFDTHGGNIPTLDGSWQQHMIPDPNHPGKTIWDGTYNLQPGLDPVKMGRPNDFTEVLFECSSAFGTTGLSAGLTPLLSVYSKISLIFLMFIGQLGVSSTILVWGKRKSSEKHYGRVEQDITIG